MTPVKLGHRTRNRQHWSVVRTRGTSTGDPCSCRYTNGLLVEFKVQTLYGHNTRRRTIKVWRGSLRSYLRASRARKQKKQKSTTGTSGIKQAALHASGARCATAPISVGRIRSLNNKAVKGKTTYSWCFGIN